MFQGPPEWCIFYISITDCPEGFEYRNSSLAQASCHNLYPTSSLEEQGCFCPVGKVLDESSGSCILPEECPGCSGLASGDPHYWTFDGLRYDLFDHCSHIFSKDCKEETFAVYSITSDHCSGRRTPTCIDQAVVEVPPLNVTVHLKGSPLSWTLAGSHVKPFQLGVTSGNSRITVLLYDYNVVVSFGLYYLRVTTPASYSGKLCGLLGDCNGDLTNEFSLMDENRTHLKRFEEEYRVSLENVDCNFTCPPPPPDCLEESRKMAEQFCSILSDINGTYSPCFNSIPPEQSYQNCILDHCSCEDEDVCGCIVIKAYAESCRAKGISLGAPPPACSK